MVDTNFSLDFGFVMGFLIQNKSPPKFHSQDSNQTAFPNTKTLFVRYKAELNYLMNGLAFSFLYSECHSTLNEF